ncbi:MAG: aspartate-semialdehyde dehydrogenase [Defluviitaleaceae bacterium]|nr:aspartate-semialdehyde dehydrogenase [Defluviitaleaceae bacterium]
MNPFTCAVVGASGMVGGMFIKILEERKLPISQLIPLASARSAGKEISFNSKGITIEELTLESFDRGIDYALFAVDDETSREYAPLAAAKGCIVIDNSSAWRMEPDIPLVVPEVNGDDLHSHKGIIANPNCCAAPAVVALKPLQETFGIDRVVISTYQSVSGAGVGGMNDLKKGENNFFPHQITHNIIPHIGSFHESGYTGEEIKLMAEVQKMLHQPDLKITATTVRVPVFYGHSLSINVSLKTAFTQKNIHEVLSKAPGIVLYDDPSYPMPITAAGTDKVHVGRLRQDPSCENGLNMWVVTDNTRKGAATNAVQILESLLAKKINSVKSL